MRWGKSQNLLVFFSLSPCLLVSLSVFTSYRSISELEVKRMPLKIGLLVGREWSWPPKFLEEVQRLDASVVAEYAKLGGTRMNEPCPYAVIIDRISHEVPYYPFVSEKKKKKRRRAAAAGDARARAPRCRASPSSTTRSCGRRTTSF